ncbi:protein kinase [Streptomyces monticola]|uniref:non-specific serine/threonine protein kinase n=1 Tax=Streptomyces monticola TaxID=2666263 RepID=A0ABW2JSF9_9ACTN
MHSSHDDRDDGLGGRLGGGLGNGFGGIEPLSPTDPPRVGPYQLLGRLGAGGMGRVYLARSEGGRTVAVKVVHEEHTSDRQFRARFRREVEAARSVGGRFTAPVLDADPQAERPWVATGYVPGPSLEQVVREYGPLPAASVHALADGMLRALQGIHGAGIVHRDLKPSNVMLTVEGPKVIDFGIARAVQTSIESLLTSTGMVVGSPGFMAPEQIRGEETGPKADVFALGCMLVYAATGRLAFGHGASNQHALMYRIVEDEPDLDRIEDTALRALIARCLTKGVTERPDVDALLADPGRPATAARGSSASWLPGELVAHLAQHTARLLDAEAPLAAASTGMGTGTGTPEPGAPGEAEEDPQPEPAPDAAADTGAEAAGPEADAGTDADADEAAPTPSDPATFRLRRAPSASEAPAPKQSAATGTDRPGTDRRGHRRTPWIIAAAALAVLATSGTVYLFIERDRDTQGADSNRSAPPASSNSPSSPAPSKSEDADAKGKDEDKGKGKEDGKGKDSGGDKGDAAAAGAGGGDGDPTGAADDQPAEGSDGSQTSGGGSGSGGGDSGGSGGGEAPANSVPSYFLGSWANDSPYGGPTRITVQRATAGQQAVTFYGTTGAPGQNCVNVARLISVQNGGSRLNLDTATVDKSRSNSACGEMKPSYLDTDEPSGMRFYKDKAFTQENQAWTFHRA